MCPEENGSQTKMRVMLADDHVLVRQGIRQFLEETVDIEVIAEAGDGAEAIQLVQHLGPDIVVMDINMPKVTGMAGSVYPVAARHRGRVAAFYTEVSPQ